MSNVIPIRRGEDNSYIPDAVNSRPPGSLESGDPGGLIPGEILGSPTPTPDAVTPEPVSTDLSSKPRRIHPSAGNLKTGLSAVPPIEESSIPPS